MRFPLRIGEETTITNAETGEPVRVPLTAGEDGKVAVVVEGPCDSSVQVKGPPGTRIIWEPKRPPPDRLR